MNKIYIDTLNYLNEQKYNNQRELAEQLNCSLGTVNKSLKFLLGQGYIDYENKITDLGKKFLDEKHTLPTTAVILAAGLGMRMAPISKDIPKGLIEINGERLVERLIMQLQEVQIQKIYIVVGYLKEKYEYLIDKYNVELIVNSDYTYKNNIMSLNCILDRLENVYIIPCDIYCKLNPFKKIEYYSWYLLGEKYSEKSNVRINRHYELVKLSDSNLGIRMIGIAYLTGNELDVIKNNIKLMVQDSKYDNCFWEDAFWYNKKDFSILARVINDDLIYEVDTYEQLKEIDIDSKSLNSDTLEVITNVFNTKIKHISNIEILKTGMTNRSFVFEFDGKKYIMRVPGEGTGKLINRRNEYMVYQKIKDLKISDDIYYINPDNGYKITKLIPQARVCDLTNWDEVKKCMIFLRGMHDKKIHVDHKFDLFDNIEYYESLWMSKKSVYDDYEDTKYKVFELRKIIDSYNCEMSLTHIDAVPDNFLIDENGKIRLIDWEYAGMQDPHVDIAMFAIYALYSKEQIDRLVNIYFDGFVSKEIKIKIYCYISVCGLLWSNWCEFKRQQGVEFGEYSLYQYRYAKEYYRLVMNELKN